MTPSPGRSFRYDMSIAVYFIWVKYLGSKLSQIDFSEGSNDMYEDFTNTVTVIAKKVSDTNKLGCLNLPERPLKYRKDQRIIGAPKSYDKSDG